MRTPIQRTTALAVQWQERRDLRALIFPLVGLVFGATMLAKAVGPLLLRDAPLLLLALQPDPPILLLVGTTVELGPFLLVATVARFISEAAYYLLGRWYGERALRAVVQRLGRGQAMVTRLERLSPRARDLAVFCFPHPLVLIAAGVAGMPMRRYSLLTLIGTLVMIVALWLIATAGAAPLGQVVALIAQYAVPLTIGMIALTTLTIAGSRLRTWLAGTKPTLTTPLGEA